jgi:hypothetical protein
MNDELVEMRKVSRYNQNLFSHSHPNNLRRRNNATDELKL